MSISLKAIDTRVTALENKIVNSGYMVPDWSKGTDVTSEKLTQTSPFIANQACYLVITGYHSRARRNIVVNGITICTSYFDYGGDTHIPILLSKGDKVWTSRGNTARWFPLKAIKLYYNFIECVKKVISWL